VLQATTPNSKPQTLNLQNATMESQEPASKKRKRAEDASRSDQPQTSPDSISLASLCRVITPPPRSSAGTPAVESHVQPPPRSNVNQNQIQAQGDASKAHDRLAAEYGTGMEDGLAVDDEEILTSPSQKARFLPSPVQLTRIRDLPASSNVDTVRLTDILSDPLIKELWNFNYLFDLDFVM
jgi:tyrosyl-DNA phosphodiesterase-1